MSGIKRESAQSKVLIVLNPNKLNLEFVSLILELHEPNLPNFLNKIEIGRTQFHVFSVEGDSYTKELNSYLRHGFLYKTNLST